MHDADIDSWNAMIGRVEIYGYRKDAFKLFDMHDDEAI